MDEIDSEDLRPNLRFTPQESVKGEVYKTVSSYFRASSRSCHTIALPSHKSLGRDYSLTVRLAYLGP